MNDTLVGVDLAKPTTLAHRRGHWDRTRRLNRSDRRADKPGQMVAYQAAVNVRPPRWYVEHTPRLRAGLQPCHAPPASFKRLLGRRAHASLVVGQRIQPKHGVVGERVTRKRLISSQVGPTLGITCKGRGSRRTPQISGKGRAAPPHHRGPRQLHPLVRQHPPPSGVDPRAEHPALSRWLLAPPGSDSETLDGAPVGSRASPPQSRSRSEHRPPGHAA